MRNRQKSLQRLLRVKTQLHELEQARLAEIQKGKEAMAEKRRAMFDLLGDDGNDRFILGLACRQISRADKSERELARAEQAQKQALLQRSAQKKALEKILKETTRALERDAERRVLQEIGERLATRPPTSLP